MTDGELVLEGTLYVGRNIDDIEGHWEYSVALEKIESAAGLSNIHAYTVLDGSGYWRRLQEPMLLVRAIGATTAQLKEMAGLLCETMEQHEVLLTVRPIEVFTIKVGG
jgi:hypothetical protein